MIPLKNVLSFLYGLLNSEVFQITVFAGVVYQNYYLTEKLETLGAEYLQLAEEYADLQVICRKKSFRKQKF